MHGRAKQSVTMSWKREKVGYNAWKRKTAGYNVMEEEKRRDCDLTNGACSWS